MSSIPPAIIFVFEKAMFVLLKTRVNGARYRSPEGSAHVFLRKADVFLRIYFCVLFFHHRRSVTRFARNKNRTFILHFCVRACAHGKYENEK